MKKVETKGGIISVSTYFIKEHDKRHYGYLQEVFKYPPDQSHPEKRKSYNAQLLSTPRPLRPLSNPIFAIYATAIAATRTSIALL